MIKNIVKYADKIYVRTKGSYRFLEDIGLPKGRIQLGSDIIFNKTIRKSHDREHDFKNLSLILRSPANSNQSDNINDVLELCENIVKKFGFKLAFIPFQLEDDLEFILKIVQRLNFPVTVKRWNKPVDLFKILENMDIIVSQRLHGLIIGTIINIPMIAISNDPKIDYFMDEIKQNKFIFQSVPNLEEIIKRIEYIRDNYTNISKELFEVLSDLRNRSKLQLCIL